MAQFWDAPLLRETGLLLLAVLLGGAVGWNREQREHPAGLRTHILVCVGAALIAAMDRSIPSTDGRIAAQIVTGIGFLGAGTIIRDRDGAAVRGLTTAASIWATAGIGIAVGYGGIHAELAAVATIIVLLTLTVLNRLENYFSSGRRRQEITLTFRPDADPLGSVSRLMKVFRERQVQARNLQVEKKADSTTVAIQLIMPHHANRDDLAPAFETDKSIIHYEWKD